MFWRIIYVKEDLVPCSLLGLLFVSQSTMVVLHALSEYLISKPPPEDLSLDVDLRIRGRKEIRFHFDPSTAYAARSSRVGQGPGRVRPRQGQAPAGSGLRAPQHK